MRPALSVTVTLATTLFIAFLASSCNKSDSPGEASQPYHKGYTFHVKTFYPDAVDKGHHMVDLLGYNTKTDPRHERPMELKRVLTVTKFIANDAVVVDQFRQSMEQEDDTPADTHGDQEDHYALICKPVDQLTQK